MKKIILFLSIAFFVVATANAQKPKRPALTKKDFADFINKTNMIIKKSADEVKKNKVYTGGIVAAIDYQKQAIDELKTNRKKAINDSYVARRLAFRAYKENTKNLVPKEWLLTRKEKAMVTIRITPQKVNGILEKYKDKENEDNITPDNLDDVTDEDVPDDNNSNADDSSDTSKGKTQQN